MDMKTANAMKFFQEPVNMNMDTLLFELLAIDLAHENLWTMPWTPWIVMRDICREHRMK